jgi:hypothetical protein
MVLQEEQTFFAGPEKSCVVLAVVMQAARMFLHAGSLAGLIWVEWLL